MKSPLTRGGRLAASSTPASEREQQAEIDWVDDLAALLEVLGLTEGDILPEMSKRNQALVSSLGQEREGVDGLGGEAPQDR